jgi:hypothetical protein
VSPDPRLYLAEGVAAVVEVKSNVAAQWPQAQHTSAQLAPLRRSFGATMQMGGIPPTEQIPLFVASYTGGATMETIERISRRILMWQAFC